MGLVWLERGEKAVAWDQQGVTTSLLSVVVNCRGDLAQVRRGQPRDYILTSHTDLRSKSYFQERSVYTDGTSCSSSLRALSQAGVLTQFESPRRGRRHTDVTLTSGV